MHFDVDELPIVEASTAQAFGVEREPEWTYQMQTHAAVDAQAHDIAGVGRDLGFVEYDMKHDGSFGRTR